MLIARTILAGTTAGCCLLVLGCGPTAAPKKPSSEALVLEKLGEIGIDEVIIFPKAGHANTPETEATLTKVSNMGVSLKDKVNACRTIPDAVPAELKLAQPPDVANVEEAYGPTGGKARRKSEAVLKEVDFYTYGDLEVGVDGGKVVVVKVNK